MSLTKIDSPMLRTLLMLSLSLILSLHSLSTVYGHGGTPRILSINPHQQGAWITDTLGFFYSPLPALESSPPLQFTSQWQWSWLCDDAVDLQSGVDLAHVFDENRLLALARSGLYRSNDRGCTFQKIEGALSEHVPGGLSPHPTQQGHALLFTHTLGRMNQVFRTQDFGQTWTPLNLEIEGGIYTLIRDPQNPEQFWVNHAQGLSFTQDGGDNFQSLPIEDNDLNLRPQELKLLGVGLDADQSTRLFMSVNRYPTSLLLTSNNKGQTWQLLHSVDDAYQSLVYLEQKLLVATSFEGLFSRSLTSLDLTQSTLEDPEAWQQNQDQSIDCLVIDEQKRIWGCQRSLPTDWLVGYTLDFGQSWIPVFNQYQEAAEQEWMCPANAPSIEACSHRCLDEGCDPSGLSMLSESMMDESGGIMFPFEDSLNPMTDPVNTQENQLSPPSSQGCQHTVSLNLYTPSIFFLQKSIFQNLFVFVVLLLVVLYFNIRRERVHRETEQREIGSKIL